MVRCWMWATGRLPGLYGVGNCVASASARAYWAGAHARPILALSYLAANAAHAEPVKQAEAARDGRRIGRRRKVRERGFARAC